MKNTHGGVLLWANLQAFAWYFIKSNTPPWEFFTFFNCTCCTKSRKTSRMIPNWNAKQQFFQIHAYWLRQYLFIKIILLVFAWSKIWFFLFLFFYFLFEKVWFGCISNVPGNVFGEIFNSLNAKVTNLETSQLVCSVNQLTGFCMMAVLASNAFS